MLDKFVSAKTSRMFSWQAKFQFLHKSIFFSSTLSWLKYAFTFFGNASWGKAWVINSSPVGGRMQRENLSRLHKDRIISQCSDMFWTSWKHYGAHKKTGLSLKYTRRLITKSTKTASLPRHLIFIKQIRVITATYFLPPNEMNYRGVRRHDEKHSRQWQSTKYPFSLEMSGLACTLNLMMFPLCLWGGTETGRLELDWLTQLLLTSIRHLTNLTSFRFQIQAHLHSPAWKAWKPEFHSKEKHEVWQWSISKKTSCTHTCRHMDLRVSRDMLFCCSESTALQLSSTVWWLWHNYPHTRKSTHARSGRHLLALHTAKSASHTKYIPNISQSLLFLHPAPHTPPPLYPVLPSSPKQEVIFWA